MMAMLRTFSMISIKISGGGEKLAAAAVGYKVILAILSTPRLNDNVMDAPIVSYIIASTMRTGSYLLCEGLEATQRAGHPREVFCPERRGMYEGEWHLPKGIAFADFLRRAIDQGTTANGVFGTKIHYH